MQQANNNLPQPGEDKNLDPYNALQKVIRLDKKHTNFQYIDKERNICFRVTYPIPPFQAPNNQHLLKGFWRHVNNYYFKRIQQSQLQRLDYLQLLLKPLNQCDVRFSGSEQFWYTIDRIYSDQYKQRYTKSDIDNLDCKNWLEYQYLIWQAVKMKQKGKNKIINQIQKVHNCLDNIHNYKKLQDNKKIYQKLINQQSSLKNLLPNQQDQQNQVQQQIRKLQQQLQQKHINNRILLQTLKNRVHRELNAEEVMIIKYNDEEGLDDSEERTIEQEQSKIFKTKRKLQKIQTTEVTKIYLKYCIQNLQKKQIAESIAKIINLQKGKGNTQNKFSLDFQTGMNLKRLVMTQKQMNQLNNLRQYNLFKFYNTSLKTPYSFICQNYFGFRQIYDNRLKPCSLKDKNILQQMKRNKTDFNQSKASKQFNNFDICHHCKLIYPQIYLTKCQYNSNKNGIPITPSSYYDPYVSQIMKMQQPKLSNRFIGRKRTCYLDYTKKNDQYTCQRKFCKYCMKQNYQDGLDKNGLCPFCQGICFCTRCARNDMMIRLKSMFLLLGGDIQKLQQQSFISKISHWDNNQTNTQTSNRNISRSKTRPTKKPLNGTPAKLNQKMRNIRFQLQDLRILCDLVKRRQKQKQKIVQIRSQTFNKKINILSKSFDCKGLNQVYMNQINVQEDEVERKKQKGTYVSLYQLFSQKETLENVMRNKMF